MSVVMEPDLEGLTDYTDVIYRTVRQDGTKGFLVVEQDDCDEDPISSWDNEGELTMFNGWFGSKATDAGFYLNSMLETELYNYNNEEKRLKFYEHIVEGRYKRLFVRDIADPEIEYDSYIDREDFSKALCYKSWFGGDKIRALGCFNNLEDFEDFELHNLVNEIDYDELPALFKEFLPNLCIIPIDAYNGGSFPNKLYIGDNWERCQGFWKFDFNDYKDKGYSWTYWNDPDKWKQSALDYVKAMCEETNLFFNGEVYGVITCDAKDVDEALISEAEVLPKRYPGLRFDLYKAYKDAIRQAPSNDACWGLYGLAGIRVGASDYGIVSVEEFMQKD